MSEFFFFSWDIDLDDREHNLYSLYAVLDVILKILNVALAEWTPYFTAGLVTLSVNCYVYSMDYSSSSPASLFFQPAFCVLYMSLAALKKMKHWMCATSSVTVDGMFLLMGSRATQWWWHTVHHLSIHCQKSLVSAWNILRVNPAILISRYSEVRCGALGKCSIQDLI